MEAISRVSSVQTGEVMYCVFMVYDYDPNGPFRGDPNNGVMDHAKRQMPMYDTVEGCVVVSKGVIVPPSSNHQLLAH